MKEGVVIKGNTVVRDSKKEWFKIDGVTLGESEQFSYKTLASNDIGSLLDRLFLDPNVKVVVYNWGSHTAYAKSGFDVNVESDSTNNSRYSSFIRAVDSPAPPVSQNVEGSKNMVPGKSGFLYRDGQNIILDGKPFIAVGSNAYWLGYTEQRGYPSRDQQEEMFIACKRMMGNSIRSHTLGHSSGGVNSLRPSNNNLNEKAWEAIDYSFHLAKKYDIKIVAPLTDTYFWYNGNYGDFCKTRGVEKSQFWTNRDVISDFKNYIHEYLNHYNKYNGCAIKDDPSLGIIEIGNELGNIRHDHGSVNGPSFEWLKEISDYIRSIDTNHLIINPHDEAIGKGNDFKVENLDIHGSHFYYTDTKRLDYGVNESRNINKPYVIGEYSAFSSRDWFNLIESRKIKGSMFWCMYPHENGIYGGNRIPHGDGFTIHYDEGFNKELLELTNHFCRLRGIPEVSSLDYSKSKPVFSDEVPKVEKPSVVVIEEEAKPEENKNECCDCVCECCAYHKNTDREVPSKESPVPVKAPVEAPAKGNSTLANWSSGVSYTLGDLVYYQNNSYECVNNHTSIVSWEPSVHTQSLWKKVSSVQEPPVVSEPVKVEPVVSEPVKVEPVVSEPSGPVSSKSKKRAIYYHCNWSGYARNYQIKDLPSHVKDVAYAFWNLDASGNIVSGDAWADYQKRFTGNDGVSPPDTWNEEEGKIYGNFGQLQKIQNSRDLGVTLSIGGWSWSKNFSPAVSTKPRRTTFIKGLINAFKTYKIFSGVSLDWEYLSNDGINHGLAGNIAKPEDFNNCIKFIKELRKALRDNGMGHYTIAFCCAADPSKCDYPIEKLVGLIDEMHSMTYDFHDGSWGETKTAFHTNPRKSSHGTFSSEEAADFLLSKGIPSHKIFIGVAFYSRGYSNTEGPGESASGGSPDMSWDKGSVDYKNLPMDGATEYNDPESLAAYSYDPVKKVVNTYDNTVSVIEKCKIVQEKDLGGLIIWESSADVDYDNPRSLIRCIHENLNKQF